MAELTPITRLEQYLDGIVNGGPVPSEAVTREESYLDCIFNSQVCPLTPITRIETYLGKISGQDVTIPEPVTRAEKFLAAIAGADVVLPDPITRLEQYLAAWADGGGGDASPIVGTGKVGSMRVAAGGSSHAVTVTLTNPQDPGYFSICEIFAMDSPNYEDVAQIGLKIGEITQASGNVTLENCPSYFAVFPEGTPGAVVMVPSSGCSGSGGVAYVTPPSGSSWDFAIFEATGDGTAILSGVDYDV